MITQLRLNNFKSWKDTDNIALKPITGFFGPNSSGKTSLLQALLLMKQTVESRDRTALFNFGDDESLVDLGDFVSVLHKRNVEDSLKISLSWNLKEKFFVPEPYSGRVVSAGESINFQVEARARAIQRANYVSLESMCYCFGHLTAGMNLLRAARVAEYEVFIRNSHIDNSNIFGLNILQRRHSWSSYEFPGLAGRVLGEVEFLSDLEHDLELLLEDTHYLGPYRAFPHRTYRRSASHPGGIGADGRLMVDAMLSARERRERIDLTNEPRSSIDIDEYIAQWLKKLGLVDSFRVSALTQGRPIYEVLVRKSVDSIEVPLSEVGFGVSQILPVLVLCFYAEPGSTLIFEQPEIHLHPAVQSALADVFIDAYKLRGIQIVFESHSEHLLRRLQRRIAEEHIPEDDVGLFFCSIGKEGYSTLEELNVDQFGNISNWPKGFFGDQFGEIAAMSEAALQREAEFK